MRVLFVLGLAGLLLACSPRGGAPSKSVAVAVTPVASEIPEREEGAERTATPPADISTQGCNVEIGKLLIAEVFHGAKNTPARKAQAEPADPMDQYLSCIFDVRLNGRHFVYEHIVEGNETFDRAQCSMPSIKTDAAARVHKFTNECTEPHAGAYWGNDLIAAQ